jgi:hypothetical protein
MAGICSECGIDLTAIMMISLATGQSCLGGRGDWAMQAGHYVVVGNGDGSRRLTYSQNTNRVDSQLINLSVTHDESVALCS